MADPLRATIGGARPLARLPLPLYLLPLPRRGLLHDSVQEARRRDVCSSYLLPPPHELRLCRTLRAV